MIKLLIYQLNFPSTLNNSNTGSENILTFCLAFEVNIKKFILRIYTRLARTTGTIL